MIYKICFELGNDVVESRMSLEIETRSQMAFEDLSSEVNYSILLPVVEKLLSELSRNT
jgi:hypothetical protein